MLRTITAAVLCLLALPAFGQEEEFEREIRRIEERVERSQEELEEQVEILEGLVSGRLREGRR